MPTPGPEDQGHHHTDYTIYYYADGIAGFNLKLLDWFFEVLDFIFSRRHVFGLDLAHFS